VADVVIKAEFPIRPHDLPHGGRTPDATGVAAVDDHPCGACQTGSDYSAAGRWGTDRPYQERNRGQSRMAL